MGKSTWRKRRMKKGLTISEVANYLEIDYKKYEAIDRGIVKMPNKFIEKFNKLMNKSEGEKNIDQLTRKEIVNDWWDEMSVKVSHGQFKLNEKMREFNINTLSELDTLLGYKNTGSISGYLNRGKAVGFDVKNKVYSFFENELNIQTPKFEKKNDKVVERGIQKTNEYKELFDWYSAFDLKKWRDEHGLSNTDLKIQSGLASGTIYNVMNKKHGAPTISVMGRLKKFIDNYTEEKPVNEPRGVTMTFTSVPTDEVPEDIKRIGQELGREVNENMTLKEKLINKYEQEVERLSGIIEEHKSLIVDLKREKDFYEKIINDINED